MILLNTMERFTGYPDLCDLIFQTTGELRQTAIEDLTISHIKEKH